MKLLAVWTLGGLQAYHATLLTAIAGVLLAVSMGVMPQVSHLLTSLLIVLQQPHMQEDACEQMTLSPPSLQPPQQSLLLSAAGPLPDARSSAYSQSQPATYAWDLEGVLSDFAHLGRSWGAQGEEQKPVCLTFLLPWVRQVARSIGLKILKACLTAQVT